MDFISGDSCTWEFEESLSSGALSTGVNWICSDEYTVCFEYYSSSKSLIQVRAKNTSNTLALASCKNVLSFVTVASSYIEI